MDADAPTLTEAERAALSRVGRYGQQVRWSRVNDRSAETAAARAAFFESFRTRVDPNGLLPVAERDRLAAEAMSRHFADMGRKSAEARRNRRESRAA
jgi:hypothetical protein